MSIERTPEDVERFNADMERIGAVRAASILACHDGLVAALDETTRYLDDALIWGSEHRPSDEVRGVIDRARAAIAKAGLPC